MGQAIGTVVISYNCMQTFIDGHAEKFLAFSQPMVALTQSAIKAELGATSFGHFTFYRRHTEIK